MTGLVATVWIPAFAGMTEAKTNFETYPCKPIKGERIRWLQFVLDFMASTVWIPAFAGMTGANWNGGSTDSPLEFSVNISPQAHKEIGIRRPRFHADDAVEIRT